MAYFNKAFLDFFKELEQNNSKDWFDQNRKVYEKEVKAPFKAFTTDLMDAYEKIYGTIPYTSRDAIKRINRDIRFSADKTPYKIHMAASLSNRGKKDMTFPGLFLQTNHVDTRIYSGAFALAKDQLYNVRRYVSQNLEELDLALHHKPFVKNYHGILGDQNKRIPKEFQEAAEVQPLILNKNFYYYSKLPANTILKENAIDLILDRYQQAEPIHQFFRTALQS